MRKLCLCLVLLGLSATPMLSIPKEVIVKLATTQGDIIVQLYPEKAPLTVQNFLDYVNEGFYNGTLFHRVIPGFMVQGGGFTPGLRQKKTLPPIKNEANNGLQNQRGTLAMARTSAIDSATSQFFINVAENKFLNYRGSNSNEYGYTVFGSVIEGIETVDKIATVLTTTSGYFENVPAEDIVITSAQIISLDTDVTPTLNTLVPAKVSPNTSIVPTASKWVK